MIYHLKSLFHLWYQHHFDCLRYYSSVARPADGGKLAESMMACVVFVHYDDVYDLNGQFMNQFWSTHFHRMESGLDKWERPSADGLFVHMQNRQDSELLGIWMKSVREDRNGILPGVDLKDKFLDRHTLTDICRTKAASRFALLISQLFL